MKNIDSIIRDVYEYEIEIDGKKEKPITIVGPCKSCKNKLRVYAYGSVIAKIPCNTSRASVEFANERYAKYLYTVITRKINYYGRVEEVLRNSDLDGLEPTERELAGNSKIKTKASEELEKFCKMKAAERDEVFEDKKEREKYLRLILCAARNKMSRAKDDEEDENTEEKSERRVQTEIVRRHMKNKKDWCVVDMEYNPSQEMVKGSGKKPDLIVYDYKKKTLGIVELKYKNDSCSNLGDHYLRFIEIIDDNSSGFVEDIKARVKKLQDNTDLLNPDLDIESIDENNIWFAFLFVGGGKSGAITELKTNLFGDEYAKKKIDDEGVYDKCYVQYVEDGDEYLKNIQLCGWDSSTKLAEFCK